MSSFLKTIGMTVSVIITLFLMLASGAFVLMGVRVALNGSAVHAEAFTLLIAVATMSLMCLLALSVLAIKGFRAHLQECRDEAEGDAC